MDKNKLTCIEFWENHYLNEIGFILHQDIEKMKSGLMSKDKIKNDWINVFMAGDSQKKNSDFCRGAERIYYWLFNQFGIPNSAPIGADMFFETYNAFVHVDVKTAKYDNKTDYFGKIPIGANQTSYKSRVHGFKSNLPHYYTLPEGKKLCLTYFINIVYDIVGDNDIIIKSVVIISVPNGILYDIYQEEIINSGKSGYKGEGFRFRFLAAPDFRLLDGRPKRYIFFPIAENVSESDMLGL